MRLRKKFINRGTSCIDVLGRTGKSRSDEYISAIRKDESNVR